MQLEISDHTRKLKGKAEDFRCGRCKTTKTDNWYFCEINKKVYCEDCEMHRHEGVHLCGHRDIRQPDQHQHWKVNASGVFHT